MGFVKYVGSAPYFEHVDTANLHQQVVANPGDVQYYPDVITAWLLANDSTNWVAASGYVQPSEIQQSELPQSGGNGSPAETATYYVAFDGSDTNPGTSWSTAFATINKAISALAASNANGGIIEVGYGTFAPFTLDTTTGLHEGVHIRGRGTGKERSYTDASVTTDLHPTMIRNTAGAGTDAITITGAAASEANWSKGIVIESLAVIDNGSGRYGINLNTCPQVTLRDVVIQGIPIYGIWVDNCWIINCDRVRVFACGGPSTSNCGGVIIGPNNVVNGFNMFNGSQVSGNYGFGINSRTCSQLTLISTYVERNLASATNSGAGLVTNNPGQVSLIGSWFEVATNVGYQVQLNNGTICSAIGTQFAGNGGSWGAISGAGGAGIDVRACKFLGHTIRSIDNQGATITAENNICQDPQFIADDSGTRAVPASMAGQSFRFNTTLATVPKPSSAAGAVTLDCSSGNKQYLTMTGNVTSLALTNMAPGAELVLHLIQDATGGRTYTFAGLTVNGTAVTPKWIGGAAPAAGASTPGYRDVYRFEWDGAALTQTAPLASAVH